MLDSQKPFPAGEDPGLNLTPMIDVVFQLIVFFLLSLKFKSVDSRIDSQLPKHVGPDPTLVFVPEIPFLTVKLFRERIDQPEETFTRIRIANRETVDLPPRRAEARDRAAALNRLERGIRRLWAARGFDPDAKGEIKTPLPKGAAVPHGDVVAVLDAFVHAGILDVKFQGTPSPLPRTR